MPTETPLPSYAGRTAILLIATVLFPSLAAHAQVVDTRRAQTIDTLTVTGRFDNLIGIAATASEGRIGAVDLRLRPTLREGELLETVPGLIVTQHSGDGKANQYFVRGFNLDHGTDFETRVEGMPVNMPSHAHGQGYTDVNFPHSRAGRLPRLSARRLSCRFGRFRECGRCGVSSDAQAGSAVRDGRRRARTAWPDWRPAGPSEWATAICWPPGK